MSTVQVLLKLRVRWGPEWLNPRYKGEPEVALSHLGGPENSNPLNIK